MLCRYVVPVVTEMMDRKVAREMRFHLLYVVSQPIVLSVWMLLEISCYLINDACLAYSSESDA